MYPSNFFIPIFPIHISIQQFHFSSFSGPKPLESALIVLTLSHTHLLADLSVGRSFWLYLQNIPRTQPLLPIVTWLPIWSICHGLSPGLWKWSPKGSLCFCPRLPIVYSQHSSQNDPFKTQIRSDHL